MANYAWAVSQLECYPEVDGKTHVVFSIHWRRQATNGAHTADAYGTQNLMLDPKAPFTPYDQLTQAQVESWLVKAMGAERIADIDAAIAKQIADQIEPPVVTPPLPWSA